MESTIADPDMQQDSIRVGIPDEAGHRFRSKAATDSDRFRPLIAIDSGHPFRRKAATPS